MGYRADLDGSTSWDPDSTPQPGDWWWNHKGTLCGKTPSGHHCRFEGWEVFGPREAPTASPSMHIFIPASDGSPKRTLWHGHLVEGQWKPCPDSPDYKPEA